MASPQTENGYTQIANEVLEKLHCLPINGSEFRLLLFVIRKTWGYHKKQDRLPLSQFSRGTGLKRSNVCEGLKSLVVKRLLVKQENCYNFNKNWEQWVVVKRLPPVVKSITASSQTTTKTSSQTTTLKRKKETISKEKIAAPPPTEVFDLEEKLKKMESKENSHTDIIATFIREKKLKIENGKALSAVIARYARVAMTLSGAYTNQQIFQAIKKIKSDNEYRSRKNGDVVDWTLETVMKQLTK